MIALLGYGKTNQALLRLINMRGQCCVVFDDTLTQVFQDLAGNFFYPSSKKQEMHFDLEIPSPGIPPYHPMIQNSRNLVSEYDFILQEQFLQVWISGTNGKTTTTEMLEWILRDCGGMSGGNIGRPLADLVEIGPKIWILETSSFSLHYTKKAFPKVYLLLPIREDHISWHGSFQGYIQDKLSPLQRMREDCTAVIPQEFAQHQIVLKSQARIVFYRSSQDLLDTFCLREVGFPEPFLLDASMALSAGQILLGQDRGERLKNYNIGAHKMQHFCDAWGRVWIDDSKGTNVDATIWALKSCKGKKIYIILGGDDKGADFAPLFEEMRGYEIEIFGIGSNAGKLEILAQEYSVPYHFCDQLQKAVFMIAQKHTRESIALLSPAAASLDQFSSYKERGNKFQEFVSLLGDKI